MVSKMYDSKTRSMTVLLMTTSFVYLIFTGPFYLTMAVVWKEDPFGQVINSDEAAMDTLYMGIVVTLNRINYAVNFVLYCLTGSQFRKLLSDSFKKCFLKKNDESF